MKFYWYSVNFNEIIIGYIDIFTNVVAKYFCPEV